MKRTALIVLLLLMASGGGTAAAASLEKGVTVLVTGANRGIGLELARQLRARDVTVIGTARQPETATELAALGARVEQLDVSDPQSVAGLAQRLRGVPIDVLVNNAGVGGQGAVGLAALDLEQFARVFSVNSTGPLRVTQALLPNLEAGTGKTVAQMSSVMGSIEKNQGGLYDYRASKTALNMFNKTMSLELGPRGFICVALHPGWVQTRMGGATAPVEVSDSVAGLLQVIGALDPTDNGRFLDYQGTELPW